jgi:DNA-binding IclR family transcriptional regulator
LPAEPANSEFSLSVSRALRILSSFSDDRPILGLTEISRELGLSKASTSRFLQALERHGFVERDVASRKYWPGLEAFRVGNLFLGASQLQQLALPLMRELVDRTGFSSYLSALQHDAMVILAALEGEGPIRYTIPLGQRLPLHCTATGNAALAELDAETAEKILRRCELTRKTPATLTDINRIIQRLSRIRARGYSVNWQENTPGVASVAASVGAISGRPPLVLSIGFATSQATLKRCDELGIRVRAAARKMARLLTETRSRAA